MGQTKAAAYPPAHLRLAEVAKALGHPARMAIVQHLARQKSCVCHQLVDVLPLAQATVSQHLKELKQAKLVRGVVEGTSVCYGLNAEALREAKTLIDSLLDAAEATACPPECC